MSKTVVRKNESLDDALRRFKRAVTKAGTLQETRKREFYEKNLKFTFSFLFILFFLNQIFDFLKFFKFSWSWFFFDNFFLFFTEALSFFSSLNNEEKNCSDNKEVNNRT